MLVFPFFLAGHWFDLRPLLSLTNPSFSSLLWRTVLCFESVDLNGAMTVLVYLLDFCEFIESLSALLRVQFWGPSRKLWTTHFMSSFSSWFSSCLAKIQKSKPFLASIVDFLVQDLTFQALHFQLVRSCFPYFLILEPLHWERTSLVTLDCSIIVGGDFNVTFDLE